MIDDETVDVTAILAQPREFLRRYENVLAQLEQAKAEISAEQSRTATMRAAYEKAAAERDAAMIEVNNLLRTKAVASADEMTARCADCGQMIMLTVQEYIRRRQGPRP